MTALPQHMQALESAQSKRMGIAGLRREIKGLSSRQAALRVAHVVEHQSDDPIVGSAPIGRLLRSIPNFGESKMTSCLVAARVMNADKRLRDLTGRQCGAIVVHLEAWAERQS